MTNDKGQAEENTKKTAGLTGKSSGVRVMHKEVTQIGPCCRRGTGTQVNGSCCLKVKKLSDSKLK